MVGSEVATLDRMGSADSRDALALSAEAGWNQTAEDWAVFLTRGETWGFREPTGRFIASGAMLTYGRLAYVSMVLVTQAWRHRGLATRLVKRFVARLAEKGATPCLDATPAGAEVYRPLGFNALSGIVRWQGAGRAEAVTVQGATALREAGRGDRARIVALDEAAFGAARPFLIESFLDRPGTACLVTADGSGFAIARRGRLATQIGPVVADRERDAVALIEALLAGIAGPVFLDAPERWTLVRHRLQALGFVVQRPFTRMALGRTEPFGEPERLFVTAGPEFG